jgi:hypothetical protein
MTRGAKLAIICSFIDRRRFNMNKEVSVRTFTQLFLALNKINEEVLQRPCVLGVDHFFDKTPVLKKLIPLFGSLLGKKSCSIDAEKHHMASFDMITDNIKALLPEEKQKQDAECILRQMADLQQSIIKDMRKPEKEPEKQLILSRL